MWMPSLALAKACSPQMSDEQLVITMHDNCLTKHKKMLLAMDPQTPDQFKVKLGRLMAAGEEEASVMDKLTDLLTKVTAATAATAAATAANQADGKQPAAQTTLAVESYTPRQHASDHQRNQSYNYPRSGGSNSGGNFFRGRGRGRGNFFPGDRFRFPNYSYGYGNHAPAYYPRFQQYGYNPFPSSAHQWQMYQQHAQMRPPFPNWQQQPQANRRESETGDRRVVPANQSFVVDSSPAPVAHGSEQTAEFASYFAPYPEN